MINPDTVEIIPNPLDYTQILEYKITTVFNAGTIIDEYFIDKRVVTVKEAGKPDFTQVYPNLFGRFPVIHLPNDKETNELYGHPIYEALLTLFARYDDVIQKSLDGVEVMGRPIPVAEGLKDPTLAKKENSTRTETVYTPDGSTETVDVVDFEDLADWCRGFGLNTQFHWCANGFVGGHYGYHHVLRGGRVAGFGYAGNGHQRIGLGEVGGHVALGNVVGDGQELLHGAGGAQEVTGDINQVLGFEAALGHVLLVHEQHAPLARDAPVPVVVVVDGGVELVVAAHGHHHQLAGLQLALVFLELGGGEVGLAILGGELPLAGAIG